MGSYVPPTQKMVNFMRSLAQDRALEWLGATAADRLARIDRELKSQDMDKFDAMYLIDQLKQAPLDANGGLPLGVYQHNGEIYVVVLNRQKTNKYSKRLVEIGGRRLVESDEVVRIEFEYAPEVLHKLKPSERMTLEQAKPFMIRYANCMVCGRNLKDATSVELAIGPVCRKMFLEDDPEPEPIVTEEMEDDLASLLERLGA